MSKEKEENRTEVTPFAGFSMFTNESADLSTKEVDNKEKVEKKTEEIKNEVKEEIKSEDKSEDSEKEETQLESKENNIDESSLRPLVDEFRNKGILDIEDKDLEDFDDSVEGLESLTSKTINKKAEKMVSDYKSQFPEDAQKFIEFVENGGDPKAFHQIYYETSSFENFPIDSEENQKYIIAEGLKLSGIEDEDEIKDEIQLLEDAGKLETKAKSHLERLKKYESNQKEQLLLSQKALREKQLSDNKIQIDTLRKDLFEKKDLKGFPLTDKLKENVWEHMTKIDKSGKTKLQQNYETNKDAQFLYAYLDMLGWDLDKLKKGVKTEVTADLKRKLSNFTDSRTKLNKGRTEYNANEMGQQKEGDFTGFKTLFQK